MGNLILARAGGVILAVYLWAFVTYRPDPDEGEDPDAGDVSGWGSG